MDFSHHTKKVIGRIGVDAGLVWIGDPCYIIHADRNHLSSELGRTWLEFCDTITDKPYYEFNEGVVTSTLHGDGQYDVIGLFEGNSKYPSAILIQF